MLYPPHPGWYDPSIFPVNALLEERWQEVRDEALSLLAAGRFTDHEQSRASNAEVFKLADQWRVFSLHRKGKESPGAKLAPITWGILSQVKELRECAVGLTYFSLVPAGGVVDPHTSPYPKGARIRNQLCLQVPILSEGDDVEITVNGQRRTWELGKVITFDDAYRHHVKNKSSSDRLVLIYDLNYDNG